MAYCTTADLTARYGAAQLLQASDREGDGVLNEEVVANACNDAAELIDSYLGERYTLPLNPVSGLVLGWACKISWFLIQSSPRNEDREAYEDALDHLDKARQGKIVLQSAGIPDAGVPVEGDLIAVAGAPRIFDANSLRGF